MVFSGLVEESKLPNALSYGTICTCLFVFGENTGGSNPMGSTATTYVGCGVVSISFFYLEQRD